MQPYYLGGDVSKGYADFVIMNKEETIEESEFQLDDTRQGHQRLEQILNAFFIRHPDALLYAAVESTGGYENNWFNTLRNLSLKYHLYAARINPKGISHDSKASMARTITDKISARHIAAYQIHHPKNVQYNVDDPYHALRRAYTTLGIQIKTKTQMINELETCLYEANPEIMIYRKSGFSKWLLHLLQSYPDAASLAQASVDELVKIPFVAVTKAKAIIARAKESVASISDEMVASSIKRLARTILYLDEEIDQELNELQKKLLIPQIKLLQTFRGIGLQSALGLFIEMGAIERFPTVKNLASYFGLHPVYKQSGDGTWGMHMSKQGRKKARVILYMVAVNAINHNPLIRAVYQRARNKGKTKKAALGVCMHKILRIVYGMLKHNQPFDESIDRHNQTKAVERKKTKKPDASRRYQSEDQSAPISYRQTQKRKERERSQSENVTMHEISVPAPSGV